MSRTAIIVTFYLHDVPKEGKSRIYESIKRDLANLRLNKHVVKRDGSEVALPRNTFIGLLEGPVFKRNAGAIRDKAREKVLAIINRHHSRATVFVFVGKDWAWARPTLK